MCMELSRDKIFYCKDISQFKNDESLETVAERWQRQLPHVRKGIFFFVYRPFSLSLVSYLLQRDTGLNVCSYWLWEYK